MIKKEVTSGRTEDIIWGDVLGVLPLLLCKNCAYLPASPHPTPLPPPKLLCLAQETPPLPAFSEVEGCTCLRESSEVSFLLE